MTQNVYIRFSNDIYADIDRGHSFYKGKDKLVGLCAWRTNLYLYNNMVYNNQNRPATSEEIDTIIIDLLNNTYGSYSDNAEAHLITGNYAGSGNDGVLLQDVEVIETIKI